ncbi:MAG: recombinase family protein [Bradyrhizobium sp.]
MARSAESLAINQRRSAVFQESRAAKFKNAFRSFAEEHLSTENELVRDILVATLASLAKLEREKISQRTKAGLERARAMGKVLGRPRFSDGDLTNCARRPMAATVGTL